MRISKILTDGSARDEALKRRNMAMRRAIGMKPALLSPEASKPQERTLDSLVADPVATGPGE